MKRCSESIAKKETNVQKRNAHKNIATQRYGCTDKEK